MAKIQNWVDWLKGCAEVSETEGFPKTSLGKEVAPYVMGNRGLSKKSAESLIQWRARCWKKYKKDNV